jgi:ankyrin repeat protein
LEAAHGGYSEIAELLLAHGADVNAGVRVSPGFIKKKNEATTAEGDMLASSEKSYEFRQGVTPLIAAVEKGHLDVVKVLVEKGRADIHMTERDKSSPLVSAIRGNHLDIVKYLLEHGANPNDNYVDDEGVVYNMLMEAIRAKNSELSLMLISAGANVNYVDPVTEESPLLVTASVGSADIAKALLTKGSDANYQVKTSGLSCVMAAAAAGNAEMVTLLVTSGRAQVNCRDFDGTTALMIAAASGQSVVIDTLIKLGATVDTQNEDGHSALMFAKQAQSATGNLLVSWKERQGRNSRTSAPSDSERDEYISQFGEVSLAKYKASITALVAAGAMQALQVGELKNSMRVLLCPCAHRYMTLTPSTTPLFVDN